MAIYYSSVRSLDTYNWPVEGDIWIARMLVGEGGNKCSVSHASCMLYAMVNRYLLHKARHKWSSEFITFLRDFSQPINPRWAEGGYKAMAARRKGKPSGSKRACSRRAHICSLEWEDIPLRLENAVWEFTQGIIRVPPRVLKHTHPRISDWAATFVPGIQTKHPQGIKIAGNWFLENKNLIAGRIQVDKPGTEVNAWEV